MTISWKLQEIDIKNIIEYELNPRSISKKNLNNLSNIIKKFGLIDKPIINQDFTLIGGHQRLKILKKSKQKTVECWVPNRLLNGKEIGELCIGLNAHKGDWDWEILANNFEVEDLLEYGFTEEQIFGIMEKDKETDKKQASKKKKECPNCGHEL